MSASRKTPSKVSPAVALGRLKHSTRLLEERWFAMDGDLGKVFTMGWEEYEQNFMHTIIRDLFCGLPASRKLWDDMADEFDDMPSCEEVLLSRSSAYQAHLAIEEEKAEKKLKAKQEREEERAQAMASRPKALDLRFMTSGASVATKDERLSFLTSVMRNDDAEMSMRLKAVEMLSKIEGDFERAKEEDNEPDLTADDAKRILGVA